MTPKRIAEDLMSGVDPTKVYPMSCFLCGLCRSVCPFSLDIPSMILQARSELSSTWGMINACHRLFLADDPVFIMDIYRRQKGISYEGMVKENFNYAFLPGCAMLCFSPKATAKLYDMLSRRLGEVGLVELCCGKPLYDLGLVERAASWISKLEEYLKKSGCRSIVTACPNCYYHLKSMFGGRIEVLTVYDVVGDELKGRVKGLKVTIHDSCPDRFEGLFAKHVRSLLSECEVIEMKHSKKRSLCCGAGGLVSCIDPSLPAVLSGNRVEEALETGADVMVVYCYSCASLFWGSQPTVNVKHILDLALDTEDESEAVKRGELSQVIMKVMSEQM